jgi:hypothetical protein
MSSVTWLCPNCGRRVPNRVAVCHCGTRREQAQQAEPQAALVPARRVPSRPAPRRAAGPPLSWEIKALAAALVLVALLGMARLLVPWQPEPVHPLLGFSAPAPTPTPRPTPSPTPLFKLPWWK